LLTVELLSLDEIGRDFLVAWVVNLEYRLIAFRRFGNRDSACIADVVVHGRTIVVVTTCDAHLSFRLDSHFS